MRERRLPPHWGVEGTKRGNLGRMRKLPTLKESLQEDFEVPVEEAALGAPEARNQNLALHVDHREGKAYLYRLDKGRDNPVVVMGYISLGHAHAFGAQIYPPNFNAVRLSASEPKYGPLMYDIGLGMKYPEWVMSDRSSVSKSARGVWSYYLNQRPDVERIYLPDHLKGTVDSQFERLVDRFGGTRDFVGVAENLVHQRARAYVPYNAPRETQNKIEQVLVGCAKDIRDLHNLGTDINGVLTGEAWTEKYQEKAQGVVLKSLREVDQVLRQEPLCWAFRLRAPENAQRGPALAKLLSNHKSNLGWAQTQGSGLRDYGGGRYLETLISNQGGDLFDDKYRGSSK